jgi:CRISPR-associated protein Csd1
MLHQLQRYAKRENLVTEPGFAPKHVAWAILLPADGAGTHGDDTHADGTPGGQLLDLRSDISRKGRRFPRAPHLTLGEMKRGGSGTRHFLADALEVVIRLGKEDDPKVRAKHDYFLGLLRQASEVVPELAAVADSLADEDLLAHLREEAARRKAKPTDNATFALGQRYLLDEDIWHDWWRAFRATLQPPAKKTRGKAQAPVRMRCFMTGEMVEPARTHPKVKGLASVGGQSSGDVLASFKQGSFQSYGLPQSLNAAMSEEAAVRYGQALSHLIQRGKRFQHAIVTYWYDGGTPPVDPLGLLQGLDDEDEQRARMQEAKELLVSWEKGEPIAYDIQNVRFYAYTLSGASGRVMVRDVIDGPFTDLLESHDRWCEELAIVRRDNERSYAKPPKLFALIAATVRDLKDAEAPLITALWRTALRAQTPFPRAVLARALPRARIDIIEGKAPRHARFGLIKAVLNRSIRLGTAETLGGMEAMKPALNEEHPSAAYHCGRAMAVLAALQYSALGDVGAGVVQRYYAAASASPALVLGRLLRNAQFHLNKLDPPLRIWYEKKIAGVLAHIDSQFPGNLDLEHQSLFALGYYQQQAHDRTKKADRTETSETADNASADQE